MGKVAFEEHNMLKEKRSKSFKTKKSEKGIQEGDISSLIKTKKKHKTKKRHNVIKDFDLDHLDDDTDEYDEYYDEYDY